MERYHALSDATMDSLLESLESLLDDMGNPAYEVEYHVSQFRSLCFSFLRAIPSGEWRSYSHAGRQGHVCDQ